jgi:uncharacterized protein
MPWFLLLGFDDPGYVPLDHVADDELDEAHWSYMDLVADRLLARGPMLTLDHDGHVGSIHVLQADSYHAAMAFASNEPYYLAGLYERLEVVRFESWLDDSMWARVGDPLAGSSWLAMWRCERPMSSVVPARRPEVPDSVLCAGWMIDDADGTWLGAAAVFDAR